MRNTLEIRDAIQNLVVDLENIGLKYSALTLENAIWLIKLEECSDEEAINQNYVLTSPERSKEQIIQDRINKKEALSNNDKIISFLKHFRS